MTESGHSSIALIIADMPHRHTSKRAGGNSKICRQIAVDQARPSQCRKQHATKRGSFGDRACEYGSVAGGSLHRRFRVVIAAQDFGNGIRQ
jgi:hypothetical protein